MNYIFYGTEQFLIDNEIKKLINENQINDFSITKYDLEVDDLNSIILDASTVSLFSEKKLILCSNAIIFASGKKEINTEPLEKYLKNSNENTILIFIIETIDERKKIVKEFKTKGKALEFKTLDNVYDIVKRFFNDYKIDSNNLNLLISRVGKNIQMLENEAEKLKNYKINDKIILAEDIINLTNEKISTDVFELIDNIVLGNKEKALTIYSELLKYNKEPIQFIIMLANQVRTIFQAKTLLKEGHSEKEIATILGAHPFYIKQILKKGIKYDNKDLLKYLSKLADIDYNIKTGKIKKDIALEIFIMEI